MIELVKALVDTVAKALPSISAMRKDKRSRELGAGLFMLYVRLNEMTLIAEDIIGCLETYAERMQRHLDHGDDPHALTGGSWISEKIDVQVVNLDRVARLLWDRGQVLQIMDTDSYNQLILLIDWKSGALRRLLDIMRSGALPLPSQEDLQAAMGPDTGRRAHSVEHQNLMHEVLEPQWKKTALPTGASWGSEIYPQVLHYLQERKPREQLDEIRAALAAMRTVLDRHFSIADILLEVGDERLR